MSISFRIGPSDSPEQIEVAKPSHPILNETARRIVAAIRLPPPPDPTFSATIAIKFE
ncbi:MAG: energy transducer TonB [Alphaproteobacteria bacterium]|nr:energy transducer TonB [Alphaproteobacteria bacterium]